jgi:GNAT superfamily N-acetyltransferase
MIRIRPMTVADVPLGMRLKTQAGWNQTEADWHRFLALQPDGGFVAELDGTAVGTTIVFVVRSVAWVAMVLVDEAVRGRGIGTALMRHALAFVDERGVPSARLDATPLGRPVYEKLGFVAEYTLRRYAGVLPPTDRAPGVEPLRPALLPDVECIDEPIAGVERSRLLRRLFEDSPDTWRVVRRDETVLGFLASRPGATATHIGPCIAADEDVGRSLLADVAHRYAGQRVFIDVPLPNEPARRAVEALGLTVHRELLRMGRGDPVTEAIDLLWATSGPEKG